MLDTIFTDTDHKIWSTLFKRQHEFLEKHGCHLFWEGFELLKLSNNRIPSVEELNTKLSPATGWKTTRTNIRYSNADEWYKQFLSRHFPVTTYVRKLEELDFTPEPDVFHDTFGHLSFFMLPSYTHFAEIFAPAFLRAQNQEQRENIKRLAWFSYEFGVQIEAGEPKAFGAGLISSFGECQKVMNGETHLLPFTIDNVLSRNKAIWSMHDTLFTFDTLEHLKKEIEIYLHTI